MTSNAGTGEFDFGSTLPLGGTLKTSGPQRFRPTFVCFAGVERGKTFLVTGFETMIGRSADAGILISDDQASRRHAKVVYKNWIDPAQRPECYLEDMGSRNGTELNGSIIADSILLKEHDRIQIGSTTLGFMIKDENEVRLQKSLFEQATKDALTGMHNRHFFEVQFPQFVEQSRRTNRPLALLIIDADHFKNVNDTYGHDVGDQVLSHLALIIQSHCRAHELSARWGGEEFVVVLPDCSVEGAEAAAERIRAGIETRPVDLEGNPLQITVSVGAAVLSRGEEFHSLFRRADQQLLQAKSSGRNRACIDNAISLNTSDGRDTDSFASVQD